MKRALTFLAVILCLAACSKKKSDQSKSANAMPNPIAVPTIAPTPAAAPVPMPTPKAAKTAPQKYPYGIPVPGKKGFVTSPYKPKAGYIDIKGYPRGTEIKDPYTGKIFLAP